MVCVCVQYGMCTVGVCTVGAGVCVYSMVCVCVCVYRWCVYSMVCVSVQYGVCVCVQYLVVGAEVEQSPGGVHEVREVVEQPEPGPHRLHADLLQTAVLGGHSHRQAQLQGH